MATRFADVLSAECSRPKKITDGVAGPDSDQPPTARSNKMANR